MSTTNAQQVEDRLVEAIASFGPDASEVTRDATFEELDIDSLDMVEIAQILAQDFGIKMEPEDFEGVVTVGDAFGVIRGYVV